MIGFGDRIVRAGAKLRTCIGTHEERDKAQLVVRRAQGRGALIDTITLVDAWTMDLVKPMIDHFGTVSITRATLDDLVHLREEQCWDVGRESMTMGIEGDQAFRMVHSPEEKASALANLEQLILFARDRLTVLPDDGEELTTPASWNVSGFGEFIKPIALAREHNLDFISEDLNLRQLAEAEAVCRHAWLQAMALEFRDQGLIDGLRYARVAAQCAAAGKEFVTVDMQTLLALLGLDENDTAFGILAARIGGPHADMRSHLAVVLEVAASIWATNNPHWRKGRAIGRLLTAVVAGLGEQTPSVIVFAEQLLRRQSVAQGRRPDLAANYIADWRQGHFLAHQSRRPGVLSRMSRGLRS